MAAVLLLGSVGFAFGQDAGAGSGQGLSFHTIQFFGHGKGGAPKTPSGAGEGMAGAKYSRDFQKSSASHIAAQVVFKNDRYEDNEFDYEVLFGLYTFEGQLISANKKMITVASDWKYTWTTQTYGWPASGKWDVGTYRVKVWLEGKKVGEAAFFIHDDKAKIEVGIDELQIESLGFYEGGDFFRPGITKKPATRFARAGARRIYWVLRGRNRLHKVRPQRPNVAGYFYRPDGTLFAYAPNRGVVSPEVAEVTLFEGVGWSTPGNWEPGRFRFELEQDNRVIAERYFEVADPTRKPRTRPKVVHFGLLDAGVYADSDVALEGDAPANARRDYSTIFVAKECGRLWAEVVVVNNPNYTTPHSHKVVWEWFAPDGSLLSRSEGDFEILPVWKTASHRHFFGEDPKTTSWAEGFYKIHVTIDGRLEKVLRFALTSATADPQTP